VNCYLYDEHAALPLALTKFAPMFGKSSAEACLQLFGRNPFR
jgi:hypothetical protein